MYGIRILRASSVPYPEGETRESGSKNHGYRRLKGNIQEVSRIPETAGWPELKDFLVAVNTITTPLESVGCEKEILAVEAPSGTIARLIAYVDLIFTERRLNAYPENALFLASCLLRALEGSEEWGFSIEFRLELLRSLEGASNPWELELFMFNHGVNNEAARKSWAKAMRILGGTISKLPTDFRWQEGQGATT